MLFAARIVVSTAEEFVGEMFRLTQPANLDSFPSVRRGTRTVNGSSEREWEFRKCEWEFQFYGLVSV